MQFLHILRHLFGKGLSTLTKAINAGNLLTWPGIETLNFKELIDTSLATELGQLDQTRKNLRSTKQLQLSTNNVETTDKTKDVYINWLAPDIHDNLPHLNRKIYSDQTGKFPYRLSRGNQYLLVMYDYDSNAIVFEPLKSRQTKEMTKAFQICCNKLKITPTENNLFILDNECSGDIKNIMKIYDSNFQLVPPHQHRQNAAEKAIKTVKNHLLSGLATCHQQFPITEWDRILPQAEMTLNLLQNSRFNPKLSSWAYLNGQHDFSRTPLAPPGSKILVHTKPSHRASWAYHGNQGWYVGPAPNHYRCVKCYIPTTRSEIISDTIKFIPEYIPIPTASIDDYIKAALDQVLHLLKEKPKLNITTNKQQHNGALVKVSEILKTSKLLPTLPTNNNTKDTTYSFQSKIHKNITSEGAETTQQSTKPKKSVKKLTDEEFDKILRNITQRNKNSEDAAPKHRAINDKQSVIDKMIYTNVPTPKSIRQNGKQDNINLMYINHMFDNAGKKQSIDKSLRQIQKSGPKHNQMNWEDWRRV